MIWKLVAWSISNDNNRHTTAKEWQSAIEFGISVKTGVAQTRLSTKFDYSSDSSFWFWIQSFSPLRLFAFLKLKSRDHPAILPIAETRKNGCITLLRAIGKHKQSLLKGEFVLPNPFKKMITIKSTTSPNDNLSLNGQILFPILSYFHPLVHYIFN